MPVLATLSLDSFLFSQSHSLDVLTLSPLFHYLQSLSSVLQILLLHTLKMNLLNRCVFVTWNWQTNWEIAGYKKQSWFMGGLTIKKWKQHIIFEIRWKKAWERQFGLTGPNLPQRQKFHRAQSLTETKTQASFGPRALLLKENQQTQHWSRYLGRRNSRGDETDKHLSDDDVYEFCLV